MKKLLRLAVVLGLAIAITGCAGTTPRLASTEKPGGQTLQQEGKALENQGFSPDHQARIGKLSLLGCTLALVLQQVALADADILRRDFD